LTASGKLDLVIVASGILHGGEAIQPEKSLRDIDSRAMMDVIKINAVGPALVAKAFLPHMRRGTKSVFAALSARVGSIGDNRLGGWVSYRSSKAALNMILKTLSIEHARRFLNRTCAAIPGIRSCGAASRNRRHATVGAVSAPGPRRKAVHHIEIGAVHVIGYR
jgi:NAD(P)-dependent dehydrogenase (short-subunit alcohol dehydrogenase family)